MMPRLYMLLLGCVPPGRNIEQHDIFFGIGETLKDLVPDILQFWPEAKEKLHIDAWREVSQVNGFDILIHPGKNEKSDTQLYFINLGGYKKNEFEEFHYKMLVASTNKGDAIQTAKQTAFFRHTGFTGASSHIDDKYGVDVDDIHDIKDILPEKYREQFSLSLTKATDNREDKIHLGYFRISKIDDWYPVI